MDITQQKVFEVLNNFEYKGGGVWEHVFENQDSNPDPQRDSASLVQSSDLLTNMFSVGPFPSLPQSPYDSGLRVWYEGIQVKVPEILGRCLGICLLISDFGDLMAHGPPWAKIFTNASLRVGSRLWRMLKVCTWTTIMDCTCLCTSFHTHTQSL